jgi:transcriptional regulator with PAS, ATPase and Fis domain
LRLQPTSSVLVFGETGTGKELTPRKAEQLSESFLSHLSVIDE